MAILTNAGGLGILCADACEANGLVVEEPSDETKRQLREFLPPAASVGNPVDMIASASADDFRKSAEILLRAVEVDALIVLTINVGLAEISAVYRSVHAGVAAARNKGGARKPVLTCFMDGDKVPKPAAIDGERLPNYAFPENTARVLGKLVHYAEWRDHPEGIIPDFEGIRPQDARALCQQALRERGAAWLSGEETRNVLSAFGLPLPPGGICRNADEATKMAAQIGFPAALKLASRTIVHKTEIGAVRLNLDKRGRGATGFRRDSAAACQ